MSSKNLANFSQHRASIGVIGTPNMNATSSKAQSKAPSVFSRFSANKGGKRSAEDIRSRMSAGERVPKSVQAEKHKKKIMDVVNNLNEEELEKISEMLRVSEAMGKGVHGGLSEEQL